MPHFLESSRTALAGPELFVYLSWRTIDNQPLLADDQIQQAAYQAIGSRTRFQSCQLLAIGGTSSQIHTMFRFPASLQVSQLASISREAAAQAISRLHVMLYARQRTEQPLWERDYFSKTLNSEDISDAQDYLKRQIQKTNALPAHR